MRRRSNPLELKIQTVKLPKNIKPTGYWNRLSEAALQERELPESWRVLISWRNPNTKHGRSKEWQTDDFESAIENSSKGFGLAVYRVLRNRIARARNEKIARSEKASRDFLRRSRAAKSGWVTRRRNARKRS